MEHIDRRHFLGIGLAACLPLAGVSPRRAWDFHGWRAAIDTCREGCSFALCYLGVGLAWGCTPAGRRAVLADRAVLSAGLDALASVPVECWTPRTVCRLYVQNYAVECLTCWWGLRLTRPAARAVPGLRGAWDKDPWGGLVVQLAEGKGRKAVWA